MDVKYPKALCSSAKLLVSSLIIPFPANHKEVQKNCEITIIGSTCLETFMDKLKSEPSYRKRSIEAS